MAAPVGMTVLERVIEKIGKDLCDQRRIAQAIGQFPDFDNRIRLLRLGFEASHSAVDELVHIERLDLRRDALQSRESQETGKKSVHLRNTGFDELQSAGNVRGKQALDV